jgi:hypothetical protein
MFVTVGLVGDRREIDYRWNKAGMPRMLISEAPADLLVQEGG